MRKKLFKSLLLSFIFLGSFIPAHASSCECHTPTDFETSYYNAYLVMKGKVVDISTNWMSSGYKITIHVERSWKRKMEPYIVIHTPWIKDCGFPFRENQDYLIYVHKKRALYTDQCSRTQVISKLQYDLDQLGEGTEPDVLALGKYFNFLVTTLTLLGFAFLLFILFGKRLINSFRRKKSRDTF